ncbi:MAG: WD40 repeat domain-containing protein [Clostridiales bacterium]|nr:WD40 repeat domain-containing protein [Clostridiales bacterium]
MCKKIVIAAIVSICLVFTGCSTGQPKEEEKQINVKDTGRQEKNNTKADNTTKEKDKTNVKGELQLLSSQRMHFMSEAGYYYITEEEKELKDGTSGRHIMYMDFAAKQEVYLCAEPGCKHNNKNCTAVLASEEFGSAPLIFVCNDTLYVVSREYDKEGQVSSGTLLIGIGEDGYSYVEDPEIPVALYSMGLDGTNRTKEYTFEQGIMLDEDVLYDGKDIYLVTKKINSSSSKSSNQKTTYYYTASEYELVKYQTENAKLAKVCSLEFEDNIRWYIKGCHNNNVILYGTKYNKNLTLEERDKLETEELWEWSRDSKEVYACLDPVQGSIKEIYSIENDPNLYHSVVMSGDYLYISDEKTNKMEKLDIETGKIQKFVTSFNMHFWGTLSDKLYGAPWDQQSDDHTIYFVDINSGKIDHCTLVNHKNGWKLDIIGETGNQVLAIYDWDAEKDKDIKDKDVYDVKRKQYGLIDKKDLYQSKDRFEKIEMKGAGE